jgi:hypothetical protein
MGSDPETIFMRHERLNKWLGMGLVGAGFLCGCAHEEHEVRANPPTYAARVYQAAPPKHDAPAPASPAPQVVTADPPAVTVNQPPPVSTVPPPTTSNTAFARGEPPPPRKSFADVTAQPFFSHAPDYSWLQGQVEYSHFGNSWRLRYSSVDESDSYGGSVTLLDNNLLQNLKDGQYVRVQGHLASDTEVQQATHFPDRTAGRNISPLYHVDMVRPVDR